MENGFTLPVTDNDHLNFIMKFGTTDIILPKEVDSPDFIFQRLIIKRKNKKSKSTTSSIKEIKESK